MIVVKVELWPRGNPEGAKLLGTAKISNIGGSLTKGDYDCILCDSIEIPEEAIEAYKLLFYAKNGKRVWKECTVEKFPRKNLLVWDLIYRALRSMIGDRNQS